MRDVRELGNALIAATLSIGLTLGALSISLVSFIPEEAPIPTQIVLESPIPVTATQTFLPTITPLIQVDTLTPTATNTIVPPTNCPPPAGWVAIVVQIGETLDSLAIRYGTSKDILKGGNCLVVESLVAGKNFYVPPAPTATIPVCVKGASGWINNYTVQRGDTFFNIAPRYGIQAKTIQSVNCHPSDLIYPGDILWVPNIPTLTPTFTPQPGITYTVVPNLTEPFTQTVLPFTATYLPTQTLVPPTATAIPTQTGSPTAIQTSTP